MLTWLQGWWQKRRERRAKRLFGHALRKLAPSDIAVDCGANVGAITRRLAETGARVYAFEPDPLAAAILRKNVAEYANVTVFEKAVGTSCAVVTLHRSRNFASDPIPQTTKSSTLKEKSDVADVNSVQVEQVDFLDFLQTLDGGVSLLKMDVEGAEADLLEALLDSQVALHRISRVFVELHWRTLPQYRDRYRNLRRRARKHRRRINLDWP